MHSAIQVRSEGRRGCGYRQKGGIYLVGGGLSVPCGRLPVPVGRCPTCDHGIKPSRGWTWVDVPALLRDAAPCPPPTTHAVDPHSHRMLPVDRCAGCPLRDGTEVRKAGLLWVRQGYSVASFSLEAEHVGVSRRLAQVPRDLVVGETEVLLGHPKAIEDGLPCPGVVAKADARVSLTAITHTPCTGEGGACSCGGCGDQLEAGMRPTCDPTPRCTECGGNGRVDGPGIFSAFVPTALEVIVDGTESDEEIDALVKRGLTPVKVIERDGPAVKTAGAWVDHVEREA